MSIKEKCLFALKWAKHPLQTGALFQTSSIFAKRVASHINWNNGYVLELGAGLGNLTAELVQHVTQPEKFACLEIDPEFCKKLSIKFPNINVIAGSASDLPKLAPEMIGKVKTIVSLIPMVSLPSHVRKAIFDSCITMLAEDGVLLQGSYYWKPIYKTELLKAKRVDFVWRNMPPIHLYEYTNVDLRVNK